MDDEQNEVEALITSFVISLNTRRLMVQPDVSDLAKILAQGIMEVFNKNKKDEEDDDRKIHQIVILLKKIQSSLNYTAPEAIEEKYYLLAEKHSNFFTFEE